jgi:cytoskeletal protein CcmA (bactofilin family)
MARKTHDDALGVAGAETVIGTGVIVHGDLTSEADIIIDGTLDGTIKTTGNITVGVNAHIKANIYATNATIAGTIQGNIKAEGETSILETGHVEGDIKSAGLAISSGGTFIGRSVMEVPQRLEHSTLSDDSKTTNNKNHIRVKNTNRDHEA